MQLANTEAVYCVINKQGEVTNKIPLLCFWREKTVKTATEKGVIIAQNIIARIPVENISQEFVFSVGDMLILGKSTEFTSDTALKRAGAVQVKTVTNNSKGMAPHYKLEAV